MVWVEDSRVPNNRSTVIIAIMSDSESENHGGEYWHYTMRAVVDHQTSISCCRSYLACPKSTVVVVVFVFLLVVGL